MFSGTFFIMGWCCDLSKEDGTLRWVTFCRKGKSKMLIKILMYKDYTHISPQLSLEMAGWPTYTSLWGGEGVSTHNKASHFENLSLKIPVPCRGINCRPLAANTALFHCSGKPKCYFSIWKALPCPILDIRTLWVLWWFCITCCIHVIQFQKCKI